eukprot:3922811-Lingulodinium_polyedra.AAC.1
MSLACIPDGRWRRWMTVGLFALRDRGVHPRFPRRVCCLASPRSYVGGHRPEVGELLLIVDLVLEQVVHEAEVEVTAMLLELDRDPGIDLCEDHDPVL